MDELERRLRSALTEMAEEVPPNHHAWAEHQRRVAAKSRRDRRRPFLMAAAAAAVVALIAVPMVVLNSRGTDTTQVGQAPPPSTPSTSSARITKSGGPPTPTYLPAAGETVVTQPFELASSSIGNVDLHTFVYTVRRGSSVQLCSVTQPKSDSSVVDGTKGHADLCAVLTPPAAGKYFWGPASAVPASVPGAYVYVTSPPVDKILIKPGDGGGYMAASRRAQSDEFTVFAVVMGTTQKPNAYSALDAAGNALENR